MQAIGCNRQSAMARRILRSAKQSQLKDHSDRTPPRNSKDNPVVKKQKEKQAIENLQIWHKRETARLFGDSLITEGDLRNRS